MALGHLENLVKEFAKVASDAANAAIGVAKAGYDKLGYYAKHATTWEDHKCHGEDIPLICPNNEPSCMEKCVPDRANKLGNPVLASSNQAVKDFYDKVVSNLYQITSEQERIKYLKPEWDRLISSIDNNWENIIYDEYYKGFDKDQGDVEKLGRRYKEIVRAKKQEHVDYRNKLWNDLVAVKYFLFYENGSAEMYLVNHDGGIGQKVNEINGGWRPTWSDIECYRAGGQNRILFYQQTNGGYAEMYYKGENGGFGTMFSSTESWLATWADIEYYNAAGQDMMLFYQQIGGGSAAMYKLNPDGNLGDRVAFTEGWRATWSDIEYYRAGNKDMLLFYQQAEGGYAEMYEINPDGTMGVQVATTKDWLATWTDIEYYRVGGKDFLMFYQQSNGMAVIYEVAPNGGLGNRVHEYNNWRKTWTEIETF